MLNLFIIIYHGNKGEMRINFNDVNKMIFPSVLICNQFNREKGYLFRHHTSKQGWGGEREDILEGKGT